MIFIFNLAWSLLILALEFWIQIQNCFRIKKELLGSPKQKESWSRHNQNQNTSYLGDTIEEAAVAAAYRIAEAENKSFVAAEAVKEAERVSRMAEDSNVLLQLAKEIFEKCNIKKNGLHVFYYFPLHI